MKSIERIKRKVEKKIHSLKFFPIGKKIFFNIYVRTSSVIKIQKNRTEENTV